MGAVAAAEWGGGVIDVDALPTRQDLERTLSLLARRQAEQERLAAEADALGLSFSERMAWLFDRMSADERLAWERRWGRLGVRAPELVRSAVVTRLQPTRPCDRCGVERVVNGARRSPPLCRDCRSVMSKEEIALWAA